MSQLKNFVAVDWRSGPDRIYFFFKDTNTYSRYNIAENEVPSNYPENVPGNWDSISDIHELRFGFTTTGLGFGSRSDEDIAWLFYKENGKPLVFKYNQDDENVDSVSLVSNSIWAPILPYFDKIVAGTWWQIPGYSKLFKFLLNDGNFIHYNYDKQTVTVHPIDSRTMPGLARYKHRFITAAQNDRTFADSYWYIFLTENQYIIYNIQSNRLIKTATTINDATWPGLPHG